MPMRVKLLNPRHPEAVNQWRATVAQYKAEKVERILREKATKEHNTQGREICREEDKVVIDFTASDSDKEEDRGKVVSRLDMLMERRRAERQKARNGNTRFRAGVFERSDVQMQDFFEDRRSPETVRSSSITQKEPDQNLITISNTDQMVNFEREQSSPPPSPTTQQKNAYMHYGVPWIVKNVRRTEIGAVLVQLRAWNEDSIRECAEKWWFAADAMASYKTLCEDLLKEGAVLNYPSEAADAQRCHDEYARLAAEARKLLDVERQLGRIRGEQFKLWSVVDSRISEEEKQLWLGSEDVQDLSNGATSGRAEEKRTWRLLGAEDHKRRGLGIMLCRICHHGNPKRQDSAARATRYTGVDFSCATRVERSLIDYCNDKC